MLLENDNIEKTKITLPYAFDKEGNGKSLKIL